MNEEYTLKYEHIQPGTKVRAYDFEPVTGRVERYVEGEVLYHETRHGVKFLLVEVDIDTLHVKNPRPAVFVPMETDADSDWSTDRVVVIRERQK